MSNEQRRKAKKKKEVQSQKRQDAARQTKFIDGVDNYIDEFRRVLAKPPIWGLFGAFEVEDDDYYSLNTEELLVRVGLGEHKYLNWDSDHERNDHSASRSGKATGMACAVMTAEGRILPVVFVRKGITLDSVDSEHSEKVREMIRLLVLLHELGHAEDIYQEISFDHQHGKVDIVAAEAYAHVFVMRYLQKRNCRLALQYYINQLDEWVAEGSTAEHYVKLAAQRVFDTQDMRKLREFSNRTFGDVAWQKDVFRKRIEAKLRTSKRT